MVFLIIQPKPSFIIFLKEEVYFNFIEYYLFILIIILNHYLNIWIKCFIKLLIVIISTITINNHHIIYLYFII
jgi:hypothetical protein